MFELFSILSGILFIISYFFYIRSIFRKETKPQKASWIIWAVTDIIILVTLFLQEVPNYHLSLAATLGSTIIAILSFKYGTSGWTKTDIVCLITSVIGIVLWQVYNNPLIALIILSLTQMIASIPTVIHAWNKPEEENIISWGLFFVGGIAGLLAIRAWIPENYAFTLAVTLISCPFFIVLFRRKRH